MSIPFCGSDDFRYAVSVQPVPAVAGALHLRFSTRWKSAARHPGEERPAFAVTLDRTELRRLITVLESALDDGGEFAAG